MQALPSHLSKYFWDVEFDKLDFRRRRVFVLKRILENGDEEAVRWMWATFTKQEMKDTLKRHRGYSRKTANYWSLILDIPKEQVLCLKKPSSKTANPIWRH